MGEQKREKVLQIRLSEDEWGQVSLAAGSELLTVSAWARRTLLMPFAEIDSGESNLGKASKGKVKKVEADGLAGSGFAEQLVARKVSGTDPVDSPVVLDGNPPKRIVRSRWDSLSEVEKRRENPARWKLEQGEAG